MMAKVCAPLTVTGLKETKEHFLKLSIWPLVEDAYEACELEQCDAVQSTCGEFNMKVAEGKIGETEWKKKPLAKDSPIKEMFLRTEKRGHGDMDIEVMYVLCSARISPAAPSRQP
jgi:hypothetical protein